VKDPETRTVAVIGADGRITHYTLHEPDASNLARYLENGEFPDPSEGLGRYLEDHRFTRDRESVAYSWIITHGQQVAVMTIRSHARDLGESDYDEPARA